MVVTKAKIQLYVYEAPTQFNKFLYWQTSASLGLVSLKGTMLYICLSQGYL